MSNGNVTLMNTNDHSLPSLTEINRSKKMIEEWFFPEKKTICGVDEVGRGCLAGPLVTAAVILPSDKEKIPLNLLKDSKKTTLSARIKAYNWITSHCHYSIAVINHRAIEQHNIWKATLNGMQKAVINLLLWAPNPAAIIVDAMPLRLSKSSAYQAIPIYSFIKGEDKSLAVAAASIVAKVYRDQLLQKFDIHFPGYHLDKHKGYATNSHLKSLMTQPQSLIHRTTFLKNLNTKKRKQDGGNQQQTFC